MTAAARRALPRSPRAMRIRGMIIVVMLALLASLMTALIARAESGARLKAEAAVLADVVTLGDLVEGAGALAATPVFRSPDLGTTGSVEARAVLEAARAVGLTAIDTAGIAQVLVTRVARQLKADDFARLIVSEIAKQDRAIDPAGLVISFDEDPAPVAVDSRAVVPTRLASFAWSPMSNRFDVVITFERGRGIERLRLRGVAEETVEIATLARAIERGELVTREDFVLERRPKRAATAIRPVDVQQLAGQVARRALRAGQVAASADFAAPMVVNRNEVVTIVYQTAGLTLTIKGQALEGGAKGAQINVVNQQSKRTIQATVAGPGRVVVTTAARLVAQGVSQ